MKRLLFVMQGLLGKKRERKSSGVGYNILIISALTDNGYFRNSLLQSWVEYLIRLLKVFISEYMTSEDIREKCSNRGYLRYLFCDRVGGVTWNSIFGKKKSSWVEKIFLHIILTWTVFHSLNGYFEIYDLLGNEIWREDLKILEVYRNCGSNFVNTL